MVFLDETVVNVALPSIKSSLGFSQGSLAWVVSAYIVVFGGLVLLGGRIADLVGRRRIFLAGTALFGLASLLDGVAQSQAMLLGARALQGVGAAMATPAALALITAVFGVRAERMKALAVWGALSGLGFTAGILLGGAITQDASWRWVFLINVPVALASILVIPRLIAESRASENRRMQPSSAIALTLGMSTLVYTIVKAPSYGWNSSTTTALFGSAVALLGAFAVLERHSSAPLIPAGFLHRRTTLAPNVLQLLLGTSAISTLFLLSLYTQQVLGYTPLKAGLAYLPLAGGVALATVVAQRIVVRSGSRPLAVGGLGVMAVGMVLISRAPIGANYWADLLPALVVLGLGAGLSFVSITTAALASVEETASGVASGLLSTFVQVGGAIGVATLAGAVLAERTKALLASGHTPVVAQQGGLQVAFLIASGVALAGSIVAFFALERERPNVTAADPTPLQAVAS
jgi:EmrB/QacA subfamily drug resistance transporter